VTRYIPSYVVDPPVVAIVTFTIAPVSSRVKARLTVTPSRVSVSPTTRPFS
jgi:hypothetical protein